MTPTREQDIAALVRSVEGALDVLEAISHGDILFSAPNAAPGKELTFSGLRQLIAVLRDLEDQNKTFRAAQKACEACDGPTLEYTRTLEAERNAAQAGNRIWRDRRDEALTRAEALQSELDRAKRLLGEARGYLEGLELADRIDSAIESAGKGG